MRILKIILSILFVLLVGFFVAKGCVHKKSIHTFRFGQDRFFEEKAIVPAPMPKKPRMAIILDDWGNNFSHVKTAVDIQRPLTLSILPHLSQSRRIAEAAFKNHLGVMLHLPMQPQNKKARLEPHTILTSMSDAAIVSDLNNALMSVPHAEGVNNHMGSLATCDLRVMRIVLGQIKIKGLFFVDSYVIAGTVGPAVSKELGARFIKRDIFIDNDSSPIAIRKQLEIAKALARARGEVVVIGHDKKVTLDTIRQMVPEIERDGIELVLVKDLLK